MDTDIMDELRPLAGYDTHKRPTPNQLFMEMAFLISERGTCDRARVGAVITQDRRAVSMGYNGTPPGQAHCQHVRRDIALQMQEEEFGCKLEEPNQPCVESIHAELNAIAWAARSGVATKGAAIYCTHQPCVKCGHAILAAGIMEVYWAHRYREAYEFPQILSSSIAVYQRVIPRGYMIIPVE